MVIAADRARLEAEVKARNAEAEVHVRELEIERMKFTIAKLRHERFGAILRAQCGAGAARAAACRHGGGCLAGRSCGAVAAQAAVAGKIAVAPFERRRPARRPLPEHLPRERVVYPSPSACPCCGGTLHKLGEDVAREALVPLLRGDQPAAGTITSDRPQPRRTRPAGAYPVLKVWPASAAQPAEHGLCARGRRPRRLDARRLDRGCGRNADAAGRAAPRARLRR